jgi:hypothetical protein
LRAKKIALIESVNPLWEDLAATWYEAGVADPSQAQDDILLGNEGKGPNI